MQIHSSYTTTWKSNLQSQVKRSALILSPYLIGNVLAWFCPTGAVKSRLNEWPTSAHFDSLNWDVTLNLDFLMWNSILVISICTLNRDYTLNRDSLKWDITVFVLLKCSTFCSDIVRMKELSKEKVYFFLHRVMMLRVYYIFSPFLKLLSFLVRIFKLL